MYEMFGREFSCKKYREGAVMKNYFDKLDKKISHYKNKYPTKPRKVAMKLALWNAKCVFKKHETLKFNEETQNKNFPTYNTLKIAIAEGGGMGDAMFQTTYIKEIRKLFDKPVIIDFYCKSYKAFQNFPFIDNCLPYDDNHKVDDYDVYIISRRFYIILKIDEVKVRKYSSKFYDFCMDCKNLTDNVLSGEYHDNLFSQYALIHGKNRLEQANVHNILNIDRNTPKYMQWADEAFDVLDKYGLKNKKYITISRACSSMYSNGHPKLWPLDYYNKLVNLIKQQNSDILIIQIGATGDFGLIDGIDIDLRGKTSIEETKCLLKYAYLHIDGEGGLVHLRNFLNGKSIVLFGPTSPEIFGYDENINLRSNACKYPCEWVIRDWTSHCLLSNKQHICMQQLTPEVVFEEFKKFQNQIPQWNYSVINIDDISTLDFSDKKIAQVLQSNITLGSSLSLAIYDSILCNNQPINKNNASKTQNIEYATPYNIPSVDEKFDIVYCDKLDEITHPAYAIREFLRILKENGSCLIFVSDKYLQDLEKLFDIDLQPNKYVLIKKERCSNE